MLVSRETAKAARRHKNLNGAKCNKPPSAKHVDLSRGMLQCKKNANLKLYCQNYWDSSCVSIKLAC